MCIKAIRNKIKIVSLRKEINKLLDFTTINDQAIKIENGAYKVSITKEAELASALGTLLTKVKYILNPVLDESNKKSLDKCVEKLPTAIKGFREFIQRKISQGKTANFKLNYETYNEFDKDKLFADKTYEKAIYTNIPCHTTVGEKHHIYYYSGEELIDFFNGFVSVLTVIEEAKNNLEKEYQNCGGSNPIEITIKILQAELDRNNKDKERALKDVVDELSKCGLYKDGKFDADKIGAFNKISMCRLAKIYRVCKCVKEFSSDNNKYCDEMCDEYFYFSRKEVEELEDVYKANNGSVELDRLLKNDDTKLSNLGKKLKAVKDAVDVKTCERKYVNNCLNTISNYTEDEDANATHSIYAIANASLRHRIRKVKIWIVSLIAILLVGTLVVSITSPFIKFNHLDRSFVYSTQSAEFEFKKFDDSGAEIISAIPTNDDGLVEFPTQVTLDNAGLFHEDVVAIGANVFGDVNTQNLRNIFIPKSIINIDKDAFAKLNNVTFYCENAERPEGYEAGWSGENTVVWNWQSGVEIQTAVRDGMNFALQTDKTAIFLGLEGAGKESLEIPSEITVGGENYEVTQIAQNALAAENDSEKFAQISNITVPDSVTSIGKSAFGGCSNLTSITLPFVGGKINGTENTHFGYIFGAEDYGNNLQCVPGSLETVIIENNRADANISIGANVFSGCGKLKNITFGDAVTKFASSALVDCSEIKTLTLPFLGKTSKEGSNLGYLFKNGSNASIPEKLRSVSITGDDPIVEEAFKNCEHLKKISLSGAQFIGDEAFAGCSNLAMVNVSNDIKGIGNNVFLGCGNLTYNEYNEANYIGNEGRPYLILVKSKNVVQLTINEDTRIIANNAFEGCTELSGITIPQNVVMIGDNAFADCAGITEMVIPNNVQSIGKGAFSGCYNLTSLTIPFIGSSIKTAEDSYQYPFGYIFGTSAYSGGVSTQQYYYGSSTSSTTFSNYYIPSSLKSVTVMGGNILYGAFYNCSGLTSITILDSITSIGGNAFYHCSSLTSITIPDSVTSIGSSALSGCSSLESITIPFVGESIKTANDKYQYPFGYIFGTSSYTGGVRTEQRYYASSTSSTTGSNYYIPSSLKSVTVTGGNILNGAFCNCSNLTSITIPDSVTSIGRSAFYNCSGLTSITIPNGIKSIGNDALKYCMSLASITIPDSVTSIGSGAFSGCRELTSITIPDGVTSIGSGAFSDCGGLTSTTIPFVGGSDSKNTHFGYIFGASSYSYNDMNVPSSLKEVVITGGTSIASYAFSGCSGLTSITISNTVTSIGDRTFSGCSSLTNITVEPGNSVYHSAGNCIIETESKTLIAGFKNSVIPNDGSVTSIGENAFYNCSGLTSITIPDSITSIGSYAFSGVAAEITWGSNPQITEIGESAFSGYKGTSITIPYSVTSIGWYAFHNCSGLTSITIPDRVTSIGDRAFSSCSSLTSITMSDSITSIGEYAFYGCGGLTNITIPNNVTSIGNGAFYGCSLLESVTIPDGVASIEDWTFANCSGLTSITIPDSVTNIGERAFYGCSGLIRIVIPDSVTSIEYSALFGCNSLTSITIPFVGYSGRSDGYFGYIFGASYSSDNSEYVPSTLREVIITGGTSIGDYAFYNCSTIISIIIPDSVTSIGWYAFSNCSGLTSITIPQSVTSIDQGAFNKCIGLENMTIPFVGRAIDAVQQQDDNFGYIFGALYFYDNSEYVPSALKDVIITGGISIGPWAFEGCSSLSSITIADSVTSIGIYAFSGVTAEITWGNNPQITEIGESAFSGYEGTSITIPDSVTSIGSDAFYNCSTLISITIPDSVTSIGSDAFYNCSTLISITIPDSVTSIGSNALSGCSRLESITIPFVGSGGSSNTHFGYIFGASSYSYNSRYVPSTLKEVVITGGASIGNYAFSDCSGLTNITIPDSVTSIGGYAFSMVTTEIKWGGNPQITEIGANAFSGYKGTSITIPDSVTSIVRNAFSEVTAEITWGNNPQITEIGTSAFSGYEGTSITIPDSVTSIGSNAFSGVTTEIKWGGNPQITEIGANAFSGYKGTNITMPDSVTSIGNYAFEYCSSLTSINIPNSVTSIGGYAFHNCGGLTNITIPDSVTSIGAATFAGCSGLTSITIPEGVTSIDDYAFSSCYSLTSITIPDSVTSIGDWAFLGCASLTSIVIPESIKSVGKEIFRSCSALIIYCEAASKPSGWSSNWYGDCPVVWNCNDNEADNEGNIYYTADNGIRYALNNGTATVIRQSTALSGEIIIPEQITYKDVDYSVTTINAYAFSSCNDLTSITIPEGVTSIDDYAFSSCYSLTSITIPDSVTSIGDYTFYCCDSLLSITIPEGVTSIGDYAFYCCDSLLSITIPEGVTSIGDYAFYWCSSLTSITIPDSVTSIGDYAFCDCTSLTSILIPDSVTSIGDNAFLFEGTIYCEVASKPSGWSLSWNRLSSPVVWDCNNNDMADDGNIYYVDNNGIRYALKDGVATVARQSRALSGKINIPNQIIYNEVTYLVTSIGDLAFLYCYDLTSITIPDSVTSIGQSAFEDCGLAIIIIPDSVTSIGEDAFSFCSSLTIYCEAESKPSGWSSNWNPDNRPVQWGYKGD